MITYYVLFTLFAVLLGAAKTLGDSNGRSPVAQGIGMFAGFMFFVVAVTEIIRGLAS